MQWPLGSQRISLLNFQDSRVMRGLVNEGLAVLPNFRGGDSEALLIRRG